MSNWILKYWDRLDERYGPWRAVLLLAFAATCSVLVFWVAQALLGNFMIIPIIPLPAPKSVDARDKPGHDT